MRTTISKDGTTIAYDVYGDGHPIIMIGGTMNSRIFGPAPAAKLLGKDFAVCDYDRRGRGDSGDKQPYSPSKEIEDIAALVEATGGQAALCGYSSGAALAIEAAIELGPERIIKMAMYEAPYTSDVTALKEWHEYGNALHQATKSGDTDKMIMAFLSLVHAKDQAEAFRKDTTMWQKFSQLAPTLMYDYEVVGPTKQIPDKRLTKLNIPALVICGSDSGMEMIADTEYIARTISHAVSKVLPGQSHEVEAAAIAPVLRNFFA